MRGTTPRYDPKAPVFVALPFDGKVATQMADAARRVASEERRFLLKVHPMTPHYFEPSPGFSHTDSRLEEQEAVSAVLFAATTVGLEAVLMGIPALRFRPDDRISIDILPATVPVGVTGADGLADDLKGLSPPQAVPRDTVFAAVDPTLWERCMNGEEKRDDQ